MINEQESRKHTCCFTGHRPEKLKQSEQEIKPLLEREIAVAIMDGFGIFITGMARGVDLWAAETVLRMKKSGYPIRLICASPYKGVEKSWGQTWWERYCRVWKGADETYYISPSYSRGCYQRRNEWMVDHSARVIAVYARKRGGTRNTIAYAKENRVSVKMIPLPAD